MILWQLFKLRTGRFRGNGILAHTHASTPGKTLALIFEQLTLQHEHQHSLAGLYPGLTVQNFSQSHTQVNISKAVNRPFVALQLWLRIQKKGDSKNKRSFN